LLGNLEKFTILTFFHLGFVFRNSHQISTLSYAKDKCFIPHLFLDENHQGASIAHLCLDENYQGASIAHETTHIECLHTWKLNYMWHGLGIVCHMMLTMAHDFIDDNRDPWL
jgi:hypothetical protein